LERRLAAILAADVVGYTRLMGVDEAGTFQRLIELRQHVLEPLIAEHRGRVVKLMGDGILAEFASVIDAVNCAVAWQSGLAEEDLRFRIGVNLGDVIIEGGDIYGDGVNVATRIEGLADPGGICLSAKVYEEVKNKLDLAFDDLGRREVKNITEAVHVYRIAINAPVSRSTFDPHRHLALPDGPSIAVLPFENMSDSSDDEYFADGITDEITLVLARHRWLRVVSRHSSFVFKGRPGDARETAQALGARYLLGGSVRRAASLVRIGVELVNGSDGTQLWTERHERQLEDVFRVQDEIAQRVAAVVEPQIEKVELKRSVSQKPANLDAWDHYYRGMAKLYLFTQQGNAQAREIFSQAIDLDPTYSQPFVGIAYSHQVDILMGHTKLRDDSINSLFEAARRAIALDESDSMAHVMLGFACRWAREHDIAISEAERAVKLNPSNSFAYILLGNVLDLSGQPSEGIAEIEKGLQLNPLDPRMHLTLAVLARAHLNARRYEEAARYARQSINLRPNHPGAYAILAVALSYLGNVQDARKAVGDCERVRPGYIQTWANQQRYRNPVDNQHFVEGLQKAGALRQNHPDKLS